MIENFQLDFSQIKFMLKTIVLYSTYSYIALNPLIPLTTGW